MLVGILSLIEKAFPPKRKLNEGLVHVRAMIVLTPSQFLLHNIIKCNSLPQENMAGQVPVLTKRRFWGWLESQSKTSLVIHASTAPHIMSCQAVM